MVRPFPTQRRHCSPTINNEGDEFISAATERLVSTRRSSFPVIVLAVVGSLALFAVLVPISASSTSAESAGMTRQSAGTVSKTGVATRGYSRDPTSHALALLPDSTLNDSRPGPGHK